MLEQQENFAFRTLGIPAVTQKYGINYGARRTVTTTKHRETFCAVNVSAAGFVSVLDNERVKPNAIFIETDEITSFLV